MKRIHFAVASGAASLGWPGILGLGLLAFVCGLYIFSLHPQQARLADLHQKIAEVRGQRVAQTDGAGAPATSMDSLAGFYGYFPLADNLPDLLEKVFAAAGEQGLQLEHGEYQVSSDSAGALTRFQLTLPVRGTYPQIRKFVDMSMAEVATLSLDGIQFDRQKVGDSMLDAKVKLTVYLGRQS